MHLNEQIAFFKDGTLPSTLLCLSLAPVLLSFAGFKLMRLLFIRRVPLLSWFSRGESEARSRDARVQTSENQRRVKQSKLQSRIT